VLSIPLPVARTVVQRRAGNVLVLAQPRVIAEAELDQALDIVEQSLRA
jgi:4-aminobutyrate aminotransferase-like enzyme